MKRASIMATVLAVAALLTLAACSNKKGGLFDTSGSGGGVSSGGMSSGAGY